MSQLPNKTVQTPADVEPTLYDVLGAINGLSTDIDRRFDSVDARFNTLEGRAGNMESQMVTKDDLTTELNKIKTVIVTKDDLATELAKMKTTLVTKDYLDDKLYDLKGELMIIVRKEDTKLTKVVNLLQHKKIFTEQEAASI